MLTPITTSTNSCSIGVQRSGSCWAQDPQPGNIFPLILSKRQDCVDIAWASKSRYENRNVGLCDLTSQFTSSELHSFILHIFIEHLLCVTDCARCWETTGSKTDPPLIAGAHSPVKESELSLWTYTVCLLSLISDTKKPKVFIPHMPPLLNIQWLNFCLLIFKERGGGRGEEHHFADSLIHSLISCFLHVPWWE